MINYKVNTINYQLLIILIGYLLDLILGDPQWRWHPVRIIGRLIEKLEKKLNLYSINKKLRPDVTSGLRALPCEVSVVRKVFYTFLHHKKFSGVMLVILVVGITVFCVWSILKLAYFLHPVFYYITSVLLIYFALSVKALGIQANKVYKALEETDIVEARKSLSLLVARDTDKLDEPEIIRATVETVAESIMDGIIALLFYTFLGGPVLAWGYKAINTLDSMVGYRNKRFIEFGRPAAKIDGWLNFIPAKLTCFFIFISSFCFKKYGINSGKWFLKYLLKGPGYNSEATEAVMAAGLGVQLGGLNFYNSLPVEKALIGDELHPLNIKHIKESIKIAYLCSGLFMIMAIFLIWLLGRG